MVTLSRYTVAVGVYGVEFANSSAVADLIMTQGEEMQIEWKEELATGNELIDEQHKELITRIGALVAACGQGKGKQEISRLLQFMSDYVRSHFAAEEALQLKHNYPDYLAHKAEHGDFSLQLRALEQQFLTAGSTLPLVIQTNQSMVGWLMNHINGTDRKLADFLRAVA
jgi:hemerythrin